MMSQIRTAAKPVYIVVIVAFIGTIIFAWGMDFSHKDKRKPNSLGSVNDQEITLEMFQNAFEPKYQEFIKTNNDPSDDDIDKVRDEAWNTLVGQMLISQQIKENNIVITNEELAEYVKNMPPKELYDAEDFQTDGKFDPSKYQNYLQMLASSSDPRYEQMLLMIENSIKSQVLVNKLQDFIVSTAFVSKAEIYEKYHDENEKVNVNYIFISERDVDTTDIEITDEMLLARYEQDKEKIYTTEEKASLKYVSFKKEPSEEDVDSVKKEIDAIYEQAKSGEDFAVLAEKFSQDRSGENGGDLGWFGKGRMVKPFEEAAFALDKKGDISEPVKSQFGWHIIKLTGRRNGKNSKGKQEKQIKASHILLKTEISENTIAKLNEKAQNFREQAFTDGFDAAANSSNYEIETTRPFPKGSGSIPGIGSNTALAEWAFDSEPDEISDIIDTRKAVYVCAPNEKIPAGFLPFDEVKDKIRKNIQRDILNDKAYAKVDSLYQTMKTDNLSLTRIAKNSGLNLKNTGFFARHEFVKNVGSDPDFIGAAFNLSPENTISKPIKARSGCYILEFVDIKTVDKNKYETVADSLFNDALTKKRQESWNEWYRQIYTKAEIKDYREDVFGS